MKPTIKSLCLLVLLFSAGTTYAKTVTISTPNLDQWAYPPLNGTQAGTWEDAAFFNKMGAEGREDRSGQLVVAYDLSDSITPGLEAENYCITAVRLIGQVSDVSADSVVLDNTYDSYRTYLDPNDPNYSPDTDPGRSLELYGAGLAQGWTGFDFDGSDPNGYTELTMPGGFFNGPRQVFAASFDPNDPNAVLHNISNNIKGQFETYPWAVADSNLFSPGERILADDLLTFEVDVNHPPIQAYLRDALSKGQVAFVISSLHVGSQTGGSFLRFFTKDNLVGGAPVKLEITYEHPQIVETAQPDLDQWAYPPLNGTQAGTWEDAAFFHKMGAEGREDRSGQLVVAYDLSDSITPGLGTENYCITAVRLIGQVSDVSADSVVLDNTYDGYRTYLDPNDPNYSPDTDPGRSLELYGAGLAQGWTGFDFDGADANGYTELTMPGGFFNGPRQVFAASFDPHDPNAVLHNISNNIKGQFEAYPWAVADSNLFNPGERILADDLLTFEVDVNRPPIQAYLRDALDKGQVAFVISSLHVGSQTGGSFLRFFTKDNLVGGQPMTLAIKYVIKGDGQ